MVGVDHQAAQHATRIGHRLAWLQRGRRSGLRRIYFLNECGQVPVMNDQEFEIEIRAKAPDGEVARRVGQGALAAVTVTAWAKGAVTLLDAGMVDRDGRVIEGLPGGISNLAGEGEAVGGERMCGNCYQTSCQDGNRAPGIHCSAPPSAVFLAYHSNALSV